ncbi:MAG: glycosyltransferase [Cytophagaceae bacterium]
MKILRVIASMDPSSGGPCQGIRNSVPEQNKIGVSTEVVCLDSSSEKYITNDEFTIHALGPSKRPWQYSSYLLPWLKEHLSRFDVVIIHGLWLYHGYAVYKAIKYLRKQGGKVPPYFVMPHGMLDPYFQKAEGRKLKALRNNLYWALIEKKVVNGANGVLFTCEEELLLARTTFASYKPKKELNIGYGIPSPPACTVSMAEAFYKKFSKLRGKRFILFLSRIHEKKGVDLLLKAYNDIRKEHPKFPDLVIAGPGMGTDYGKNLLEILSPEAQPHVFFPGMLSGEDKWGAFYASEAFVLPSHQENFGIAVAEALACGKPVLISDQVNIWREIDEGGGGLVAPDTFEGAEMLLKTWFEMKEEDKVDMGLKARKVYEQHFSIVPAAKRMVEVIKSS